MPCHFSPTPDEETHLGNPFRAPGAWYRGNTHTHSTYSDGKLTVPEVADWYEQHGYDFLCITDHDRVAPLDEAADASIELIPGAEIGTAWPEAMIAEVCAIGIEDVGRKFDHPQNVIDHVLAQGGVPFISHPHMSGVHSALMAPLEGLVGLEIYNAMCQGSGRRGFSTTQWDELLSNGKRVWGWAADDRHAGPEQEPPPGCQPGRDKGKAWVMVRAPQRSQDAILEAIRQGLFYSTTGPVIEDIRVDAEKIDVRCSPVKQITFASLPWTGTRVHATKGQRITEASVDLGAVAEPNRAQRVVEHAAHLGDDPQPKTVGSFFRVEIWDGEDGYAWSNPYWFGEAGWEPGESNEQRATNNK